MMAVPLLALILLLFRRQQPALKHDARDLFRPVVRGAPDDGSDRGVVVVLPAPGDEIVGCGLHWWDVGVGIRAVNAIRLACGCSCSRSCSCSFRRDAGACGAIECTVPPPAPPGSIQYYPALFTCCTADDLLPIRFKVEPHTRIVLGVSDNSRAALARALGLILLRSELVQRRRRLRVETGGEGE